jgi:hypothetical protein
MATTIDTPIIEQNDLFEEINKLVNENRQRCFWSMRRDFLPETNDARLRALKYLATYGDRATFVKARNLRDCLQLITNGQSAER